MLNNIVVLGGGIAGISAAYHAKKMGFNATCYEALDRPGGLVSNFEVQGFRFDNAIHLSFTKNEYVKDIFNKTDFNSHKPDAFCYDQGLWLKHPIQNNLYSLPLKERIDCIESFIRRSNETPKNFKTWLYNQYGEYIANKYPIPYTKKYWGLDAQELSLSWIGERIRKTELREVLAGALEKKDENHYYADEMRYPKKGGYFNFVRDIASSIPLITNKKAVEINLKEKRVSFADGEAIKFDKLISSLPLPVICKLITNIPPAVATAASTLRWTTVDLVSIGFNKPNVSPYLWFYLYNEENIAARGYSPSWKSADNAPEGCSSLQFEIYNLSTKEKLSPDSLINNVKKNLLDMGICSNKDIIFFHHKHLPFGNVIRSRNGGEERSCSALSFRE